MRVVLLLVTLCVAYAAGLFGRKQVYKVKGTFFCPDKEDEAHNIKVKMIEKDTGPDDHMGSTRTDENGHFELTGEESEISNIDAHLHLYHDCNDKSRIKLGKPCKRKWDFKLPDKYINGDVMDLGRINLEIIMKEEEHDCIH